MRHRRRRAGRPSRTQLRLQSDRAPSRSAWQCRSWRSAAATAPPPCHRIRLPDRAEGVATGVATHRDGRGRARTGVQREQTPPDADEQADHQRRSLESGRPSRVRGFKSLRFRGSPPVLLARVAGCGPRRSQFSSQFVPCGRLIRSVMSRQQTSTGLRTGGGFEERTASAPIVSPGGRLLPSVARRPPATRLHPVVLLLRRGAWQATHLRAFGCCGASIAHSRTSLEASAAGGTMSDFVAVVEQSGRLL
ncbi:hypothetical protein UA75_00780 [Actinoalloteichus sp. GBA129-24]|uniref:Uncharacterized protein n=1 Tax=Actinoalloteichus fjordicus TaxID=1612552 RepID=A0AAC9L6V1_9PSEU|nr:hypothetical protein UA74_00780 [Actinoalloteichus fjordicus]APU18204.1 hypothetical protein UA75_00780 [Actinoalloteichus sp. GBA129-24]